MKSFELFRRKNLLKGAVTSIILAASLVSYKAIAAPVKFESPIPGTIYNKIGSGETTDVGILTAAHVIPQEALKQMIQNGHAHAFLKPIEVNGTIVDEGLVVITLWDSIKIKELYGVSIVYSTSDIVPKPTLLIGSCSMGDSTFFYNIHTNDLGKVGETKPGNSGAAYFTNINGTLTVIGVHNGTITDKGAFLCSNFQGLQKHPLP